MTNTVLVIIVLVIVLVVIGYFTGGGRKKGADPRSTPDQAWDQYIANPSRFGPRDEKAVAKLAALGPEEKERIKRSFAATAKRTTEGAEPLVALRESIMDATDRFVMAETLPRSRAAADGEKSPASGEGDLESVLHAGALRCFSLLLHNDVSEDDWYTHYSRVGQMNARNVASMVRKVEAGEESPVESALLAPLSRTMHDARQALLHYPSRTPVERVTELKAAEAPAKRAPSQKQIDSLSDLMSDRLEKLFSGRVYLETLSLADPGGALEVDAALLFTLLSVHFRQPTDAWREVMGKALGPHEEALQNEEELLKIGQEVCRIWEERKQEGPLKDALTRACALAFGEASAPTAEELASSMLEDASVLVGAIQEIANT